MKMKIRAATTNDADAVRCVHSGAFPGGEGDLVSEVAVGLLSEASTPPVLSLVAEVDGTIIAHVAFSPVRSCETEECLGYILAPLAVSPDHQRRGIASQLIRSGIQRISEFGPGVLLVYGDPAFYGRFGFRADRAECYKAPYPLQYPFGWQGVALGDLDFPSSPVSIACVLPLCNPALW